MSWKKYFTPVNVDGTMSPISGGNSAVPRTRFSKANFSSFLPDVYTGHPNRLERYGQYDTMDTDSEINAALDILTEFCTQINIENDTPFEINFKDSATHTEVKILKKFLQQWVKINQFNKRIFKIVRNAFKYGDSFFIRDPENLEWIYVDPSKVDKIIVNESDGKVPEQYVIRDLNLNLVSLTATPINPSNQAPGAGGTGYSAGGAQQRGMVGAYAQNAGNRFQQMQNQYAIDSKHVIHISMSDGLDNNFPFGNSLLESIFKVFKQKELLEDAIIIYRVQRAPERRIFYIDVGNMPTHLAMGFVERVKNEVNQRRIPSLTGGGTSVIDSAYNPLSITEDYFFPQSSDGRGSKVEPLPGGTNLGEIDDLKFFTNKLFRALRIPSSYLPTGPDDSQSQFSDGKVGTAYIQELRFNKYCERLQSMLCDVFNLEFKAYIQSKGIIIDTTLFDLKFNPPQNFAVYRQAEMDGARVNTFSTMVSIPFMSKRFALKRFLGLSQEEIAENEMLWKEENMDKLTSMTKASAELRAAGITPSGISGDISTADSMSSPGDLDFGGMGGESPSGMPMPGGASGPVAGTTAPPV